MVFHICPGLGEDRGSRAWGAMKFDDILFHLGEFGRYQKRLYVLLCLPAISVGSFMMGLVLIMETPKHRYSLSLSLSLSLS